MFLFCVQCILFASTHAVCVVYVRSCLCFSLARSLSLYPSIHLSPHSIFLSSFHSSSLLLSSLALSLSLSYTHTHRPYIPGITVNAKLLRGTVVRIPPRQGDVLRAVPPPQLFNPDLTLYAQVFFKKLRSPPLLLGIVPFSLPCSLELRASHLSITHTNTKTEAEGR